MGYSESKRLQQRQRGLCLLGWLFLWSVFSSSVVHCSGDLGPCRSQDGCVHTSNKRDTSSEHCLVLNSNPLRIGESVFRNTEILHGMEAVDLCLVVLDSGSMASSQVWLQIAVPVLNEHLLTLGIGTGEQKNRYCLVMFGGSFTTRFIRVNEQIFFPYHQFFHARRQLSKTGNSSSDGYEAVEFTVNNAPFRNNPNVAKAIILVTNTERTQSPHRMNLTRDSLLQLLYLNNIMMDTVVSISLQLAGQGDRTVLGFHGYREASILRPDGRYEMSQNQSVLFTEAAGETINDYVALSIALKSSSWPLGLLDNGDYLTLLSFANAFTNVHNLFPALPVEVCEQCRCQQDLVLSCEQPKNQEMCTCRINRTSSECTRVLPTPTTSYTTSYLAPMATPAPVAITIEGHVNTLTAGDTVVSFSSNHPLATFRCILMPDKVESPVINSCTSPYHVSTPTPGRYSLLILAEHSQQTASLLLWFNIRPASGRLEVTTLQRSIMSNASVLVEFGANKAGAEFQCSTGDDPFQTCNSPYLVPPKAPGLRQDVFIVLATDSDGEGAASVLKIEDPTMSSSTTEAPGPVRIEVWAKLPDPDGVLRICFRPTRNDVTCICTVEPQGPIICFNRTLARGEYSASPDELGTGPHTLKVTCADDDNFSSSENIKFNLAEPPLAPPPTESLHCNLSLVEPNDRGILIATHRCNRPVTSLCQVSRLQPTSCDTNFEFDTSPLGPGNHIFVLVAEDEFGESIMKVFPFFIETAQRKCCPQIVSNHTNVSVERDLLVHLYVGVHPGNCSLNEGFSYSINWGDAASESGTKTHLSNLHSSRQYSVAGQYSINAEYCNNPAASDDTCCSSVVLSVNLDSSQQT